MQDHARLAALNNAEWCDAISAVHGAAGRFEPGYWINPGPAPPFYPNLVTLDPDGGAAQRDAVRGLAGSGLPSFGIKDSFCNLDLADLGLRIAFEADWLWLDPDAAPAAPDPRHTVAAMTVATMSGAADLARWEEAWNDGATEQPVFPPAVLADARIAFLALVLDGRIAAGAALNRSDRVVGLSNVFFAPGLDAPPALAALVSAARARHPGMALCGYEHGESLQLFREAGFAPAGKLRVWIGGA